MLLLIIIICSFHVSLSEIAKFSFKHIYGHTVDVKYYDNIGKESILFSIDDQNHFSSLLQNDKFKFRVFPTITKNMVDVHITDFTNNDFGTIMIFSSNADMPLKIKLDAKNKIKSSLAISLLVPCDRKVQSIKTYIYKNNKLQLRMRYKSFDYANSPNLALLSRTSLPFNTSTAFNYTLQIDNFTPQDIGMYNFSLYDNTSRKFVIIDGGNYLNYLLYKLHPKLQNISIRLKFTKIYNDLLISFKNNTYDSEGYLLCLYSKQKPCTSVDSIFKQRSSLPFYTSLNPNFTIDVFDFTEKDFGTYSLLPLIDHGDEHITISYHNYKNNLHPSVILPTSTLPTLITTNHPSPSQNLTNKSIESITLFFTSINFLMTLTLMLLIIKIKFYSQT